MATLNTLPYKDVNQNKIISGQFENGDKFLH